MDLKKEKKFRPELIKTIKPNEIIEVSASRINLYYTCPRQFLFRYIYNWPEGEEPRQIQWPGTGYGQAIHDVLEWVAIQLNEKKDPKEIIKASGAKFKEAYDKWLLKENHNFRKSRTYDYISFIAKGEKQAQMLTRFLYSYFVDMNDLTDSVLHPEHEFIIDYKLVKNVRIKGIIDLKFDLDYIHNRYKLLDFKTTKESEKFYFVDWVIDTQSLSYLYYCLETYGVLPESFSYLVLNHEQCMLFFKETILPNDNKINKKKFFRGLTAQIEEVSAFMRKPNICMANPQKTRCYFCEYNEYCQYKYISNLGKMLQKIRKR